MLLTMRAVIWERSISKEIIWPSSSHRMTNFSAAKTRYAWAGAIKRSVRWRSKDSKGRAISSKSEMIVMTEVGSSTFNDVTAVPWIGRGAAYFNFSKREKILTSTCEWVVKKEIKSRLLWLLVWPCVAFNCAEISAEAWWPRDRWRLKTKANVQNLHEANEVLSLSAIGMITRQVVLLFGEWRAEKWVTIVLHILQSKSDTCMKLNQGWRLHPGE